MPFSNLFAGNGDAVVGSQHGHKIEMTQEGNAYVVVDGNWQRNNPAKYTYSGIAADVLAHADELGIEVEEDSKVYWDLIERIATVNGAHSPDYTIREGDTIRLPLEIKPISQVKQTEIEGQVRASQKQAQSLFAVGQVQKDQNVNGTQKNIQHDQDSHGGPGGTVLPSQSEAFSPPGGNDSISGQALQPIYGNPDDGDDYLVVEVGDENQNPLIIKTNNFEDSKEYQGLLAKAREQQAQMDSLLAHIKDLQRTIEEINADTAVKSQEVIADLQKQIEELQNKKLKIQWSIERKFETEYKVKGDDKYWAPKGGDIKLTAKAPTGLGDLSITGKLKHNGSLRYGLENQKADIQRQLALHIDNVFGSPYWVAGELNWDNVANPYGLGIGVNSWKFGKNRQFSLSPQVWYYSADAVQQIEEGTLSVTLNGQQSSYMPAATLAWALPDDKGDLSFQTEGFFTRGIYTGGELKDVQHTINYKHKGWDIRLIRGFQEPSTVKYLTRLSQEPGPYRFYAGKSWKLNGQKIGISGYWAFDDDFRTQGGKIYLKLAGPLQASDANGEKYSGLVFSSTTDLSIGSDAFYVNSPPAAATGDIAFGMNLDNFYLGFSGDYLLSGDDFGAIRGYFTKPALEFDYTIGLKSNTVENLHFGIRNGHPRAGLTFSEAVSQNERFIFGPTETNIWHVPVSDSTGVSAFVPQANTILSYELAKDLLVSAEPTMIYSQNKINIAGAMSLMYKNYGIEAAIPLAGTAAYSMGYLPYPYNFRIGPRIDFHNFSGSVYYGKCADGECVVGANIKFGINTKDGVNKKRWKKVGKAPKDFPIDAKINEGGENKGKNAAGSSEKTPAGSSPLLSRENLFGSSQSELWLEFKQKIDAPYLFYVSAAGPYETAFLQAQHQLESLGDEHDEKMVYIALEVFSPHGVRYVASVDKIFVFKENNYQNLKELFEGSQAHQDKHLFFLEVAHNQTAKQLLLGNFYLSSFWHNKLQENGFGTKIFKNFAELLIKKIPNQLIQTYDISPRQWTKRRFEENFSEVFYKKDTGFLAARISDSQEIQSQRKASFDNPSVENRAIASSGILNQFPDTKLKDFSFLEKPQITDEDIDKFLYQYIQEIKKPEYFQDLSFLFEDWMLTPEKSMKPSAFLFGFTPWRERLRIPYWDDNVGKRFYERFVDLFEIEKSDLERVFVEKRNAKDQEVLKAGVLGINRTMAEKNSDNEIHRKEFLKTKAEEGIDQLGATTSVKTSSSSSPESSLKGGIDFVDQKYMEIRDQQSSVFNFDQNSEYFQLQDIEGFFPIIIQIIPMTSFNLHSFLNPSGSFQIVSR